MNTAFVLSIALTMLCGADEVPAWMNGFGPGAEEFWRQTSALGFEEDELHELMSKIQLRRFDERDLKKYREAWQAKGVDLIKFLRELVENDVLPEGKYDAQGFSQIRALEICAMSDDTAVTDWIVSHAEERLRHKFALPIRSRDNEFYICGLLRVLGKTRREEAADILLKVQSDSFWNGEGAPKINMEPLLGGEITSEKENVRVVKAIREEAIQAIAESGTQRAIEILATGKQIASELHSTVDLDGYFRLAVRRHVGLYETVYRERYGVDLPDEKLAEIKEIYAKYGRTYEPVQEVKRLQEEWLSPDIP